MLPGSRSASTASNPARSGIDEVPGMIIERTLDEVRHARTLIEDTVAFAAQHQRQSFVRQFTEDVWSRIRAAMVKNVKTVKKCGVMTNERLYNIALAPHDGDCSKVHPSTTSNYRSRRTAGNFRISV